MASWFWFPKSHPSFNRFGDRLFGGRKRWRFALFGCAALIIPRVPYAAGEARLVIHECGVITGRQDDKGVAVNLPTIKTISLPPFVHIAANATTGSFIRSIETSPPAHTLRVDGIITYYHFPQGTTPSLVLDYEAGARGGEQITGYYPAAKIDASTESMLWKQIHLAAGAAGQVTTNSEWLALRTAKSAAVNVRVPGESTTETEKFLFRRATATMDMPLSVARRGENFEPRGNVAPAPETMDAIIPIAWLAEFQKDGTCAYRIEKYDQTAGREKDLLGLFHSTFAGDQFSTIARASLRDDLKNALMDRGIFAEEADGVLDAFYDTLFEEPGIRLLFLVPQSWTDEHLPVKPSVRHEALRILVGRIELGGNSLEAMPPATVSTRTNN